jgi:hypothetical protein
MEDEKKEKKQKKQEQEKAPILARKAFVIRHNEYERVIFPGEDLSDVPEIYLENLKTENVI